MNLDHTAGPILRTSDHNHVRRSSSLIRQACDQTILKVESRRVLPSVTLTTRVVDNAEVRSERYCIWIPS